MILSGLEIFLNANLLQMLSAGNGLPKMLICGKVIKSFVVEGLGKCTK